MLRNKEESEEIRDGIRGATMLTIEGSGHMIPIERPAQLAAAVVDWLRINT